MIKGNYKVFCDKVGVLFLARLLLIEEYGVCFFFFNQSVMDEETTIYRQVFKVKKRQSFSLHQV